MMDPRVWKIGGSTVDLSRRGMIMGVLNVTPDSFFDGGRFFSPEIAVAHAVEMARTGAQIIDVGGESSRPGAEPVAAEEEMKRVIPVIEQLRGQIEGYISIDTCKAEVAEAALEAGATVVNDISGGRADPAMFPLIARRGAAVIIMHMQGNPKTMQVAPSYIDVVDEVANFFRQQYACALECGIDPMAIAFDPGIGFGKTLEHNLELLGNLDRLRVGNQPIVIGVSRKSFLGKLTGEEPADRLSGTVALTALLRGRGAEVFRVHDVAPNLHALRMAEAVLIT
ncbi:MAG TPA: dihydropteroate synthase [Chthoniobacterales bacterium]